MYIKGAFFVFFVGGGGGGGATKKKGGGSEKVLAMLKGEGTQSFEVVLIL